MFEFQLFCSQLVPFLTQGRKCCTQKRDARGIAGGDFWLIPATAVPGDSQLKPRGKSVVAGGHSQDCSAQASQPDGLSGFSHWHQSVPRVLPPHNLRPTLSVPPPHHWETSALKCGPRTDKWVWLITGWTNPFLSGTAACMESHLPAVPVPFCCCPWGYTSPTKAAVF